MATNPICCRNPGYTRRAYPGYFAGTRSMTWRSNHKYDLRRARLLTAVGLRRASIGPPIITMVSGCAWLRSATSDAVEIPLRLLVAFCDAQEEVARRRKAAREGEMRERTEGVAKPAARPLGHEAQRGQC